MIRFYYLLTLYFLTGLPLAQAQDVNKSEKSSLNLVFPSVKESRIIRNYAECIECDEGQKEALSSLQSSALSPLAKMARNGAPLFRRISYGFLLGRDYRRIKRYLREEEHRVPPMTRRNYKRGYQQKFRNLYQLRAVHALGVVPGGGAELQKLQQELCRSKPEPGICRAIADVLNQQGKP